MRAAPSIPASSGTGWCALVEFDAPQLREVAVLGIDEAGRDARAEDPLERVAMAALALPAPRTTMRCSRRDGRSSPPGAPSALTARATASAGLAASSEARKIRSASRRGRLLTSRPIS